MSNPNLIRSTKTVRKTLPTGQIEETTTTTTRSPSANTLQRPGQGVCPAGIPRPTGGIARPTGAIPQSTGTIPQPIRTIPRPTGGIPQPTGTIPRPTGGIQRPMTNIPTSGLQRPAMGMYGAPGNLGMPRPTPPPTMTRTSKTTILNPDGTKMVTKKTQIMKSPARTPSGRSILGQGAGLTAAASASPGLRVPRLQPPMSRLTVPSAGPPAATGAVRKGTQAGTKITHTTTTAGIDPQGRQFKKSKTTVSIKDSPAAQRQQPPVRPADVSQVNIQRDPLNLSQLERQVSQDLVTRAARSGQGKARATKVEKTSVPMMMTPAGPVPVDKQVIIETKMDRSPEGEKIHRHIITSARKPDNTHERVELAGQTLSEANLQAEAEKLGIEPRDILAIQSTTSIGGGYRQKTSKVVYETDRPVEAGDTQMNPQEVAKMIEEENKDLEEVLRILPPELEPEPEVYPLRKNIQKLQLSSVPVEMLEKFVEMPQPTGDEELPELQPELIATVMHTEEEGLVIESQPNCVYNYLFPEDKADQLTSASSAAPAVVQDVLIPLTIPTKMHESVMSDELQAASVAIHDVAITPTENAYSEVTKGSKPKVQNFAKPKKRKAKPIAEEEPPWDIEDMQVIADLVGAEPASSLIAEELDLTVYKDPATQGIDYLLELQGPRHVSRVQLRGSQNPPWFPGYVVALPTIPDIIRIERNPNTVISSAWRAVQPNLFAEDSFLII